MRGELKTIGTADLKHICYATRATLLQWQTDRIDHARWCGQISFQIRFTCSFVATFFAFTQSWLVEVVIYDKFKMLCMTDLLS